MDIYIHPANLKAVKERLNAGEFDRRNDVFGGIFMDFRIHSDPNIEQFKETGRFILPGGEVVDRNMVRVADRFVIYGPEDVEWLLMAGAIRHELEINVVVMKDSPWRMRMWDMPIIQPSRNVMLFGSV